MAGFVQAQSGAETLSLVMEKQSSPREDLEEQGQGTAVWDTVRAASGWDISGQHFSPSSIGLSRKAILRKLLLPSCDHPFRELRH